MTMNKQIKVLILPAGSRMAVAAINSLKDCNNVTLVSADSNELAPGLYLSDKSYLLPSFKDKNYWVKVKKIVRAEKIDLIFPALDSLLLPFAQQRAAFRRLGAEVMVSDENTILKACDKWQTYLTFRDTIPVPNSFIRKRADTDFPLIVKPRGDTGSRDVFIANSKIELNFYFRRVKNPIIQEYLPGQEWSIDCLADLDGRLLLSIPRLRLETAAGVSIKGKTVMNKKLREMAEKIANILKFRGIFFFQAKEDASGTPKLMEINPRIAGTMSLSSESANIYLLAIELLMGKKIEIPKIKNNLYITRYFNEIYLSDKSFKILKKV